MIWQALCLLKAYHDIKSIQWWVKHCEFDTCQWFSQNERWTAGSEESKEGEKVDVWPLANTDRRQEGEEVILLIVNHIPGVLLLPFLWVAKPHSSGTEVTHSTAPGPRAAPTRGNQPLKINTFSTNCHSDAWTQRRNGYGEFRST